MEFIRNNKVCAHTRERFTANLAEFTQQSRIQCANLGAQRRNAGSALRMSSTAAASCASADACRAAGWLALTRWCASSVRVHEHASNKTRGADVTRIRPIESPMHRLVCLPPQRQDESRQSRQAKQRETMIAWALCQHTTQEALKQLWALQ
jgi:hypothetical protein